MSVKTPSTDDEPGAGEAPAGPAGAVRTVLRLLSRDPSAIACVLALAALLSLAASGQIIANAVDNLVRKEAERDARDRAGAMARNVSDLASLKQAVSDPGRRGEIAKWLDASDSVFLGKLFDTDGNLIFSSDAADIDPSEAALIQHNPIAARVVASGKPYTTFIKDGSGPGRPQYYSEAYVPIVRNGTTVAVVEIYMDQTELFLAYSAESTLLSLAIGLVVLLSFSVPVLVVVHKSRKIARAEAELRLNSARFGSALDSMAHGLSLFDREDRLVRCNTRFREMYGFSERLAVPGTSLDEFVAHAVAKGLVLNGGATRKLREAIDTADGVVELSWTLPNGRLICATVSRLADGGRIAVHRDVTEERQSAARIAESEARFRDFAATASDWCWETDAEHRFVFLTDGFQIATGVDPATVIGKTRGEAPVHPGDAAAIAAHAEVIAARKPFRDFLIRLRKPDGSYACIKSSGAPRLDSDGTFLGYRGTARDITVEEMRKAELDAADAALRQRSRQLAEAQRLGKIGDWTYMLGATHQDWGPELYELLRFEHVPRPVAYELVMASYLEDGEARLRRCQSEISRTGGSKSVDVKFRRGDGVIIDCAITSQAIRDSDGKVIGFTGTVQDITERKSAEEQLVKLAFHDPLTGLANRALFVREMDEVLADCGRTGRAAALLLLDLDRFKEVNDSLGHSSGDDLLVKVGHLIGRVLDPSHFLARLGGDEFAIIARQAGGAEAVARLAHDVIAAVSGTVPLERGEVTISTSIGIAMVQGAGMSSTEFLRNADLALYDAKEKGRGRFAFFRPEMDEAVQHKVVIARELRHAIADGRGLDVHYQPQVDLATGLVCGYEALVRWRHPTLGPIPPREFVPIAESSHLIIDLGLWVLQQAALQARAWQEAGEPVLPVSVNVSAAQIWHSDLATDVARILADAQVAPELICLELTESLLVDHAEGRVRTVLRALKDLGVRLALDDFGTDYSSLGYLNQLPFDTLKIDRIFVSGADGSPRARELLKGIVALGHGLGMSVVAEGAETSAEVETLTRIGCDKVQGFALARPMSAEGASAFRSEREQKMTANPVHALCEKVAAGMG
ncbi:MAG: EAL domain-containing protein [Hyphomicrobiaceae bacterium]|nr:EAL domain-containing protein [Hyphomicrobiaceae bacterium]